MHILHYLIFKHVSHGDRCPKIGHSVTSVNGPRNVAAQEGGGPKAAPSITLRLRHAFAQPHATASDVEAALLQLMRMFRPVGVLFIHHLAVEEVHRTVGYCRVTRIVGHHADRRPLIV